MRYNAGGAVQTISAPADHHEGLLQNGLRQSGQHLYAKLPHGPDGGFLRQEPDTSVMEIAVQAGYDRFSKFTASFKAVKGKSTMEYRKAR